MIIAFIVLIVLLNGPFCCFTVVLQLPLSSWSGIKATPWFSECGGYYYIWEVYDGIREHINPSFQLQDTMFHSDSSQTKHSLPAHFSGPHPRLWLVAGRHVTRTQPHDWRLDRDPRGNQSTMYGRITTTVANGRRWGVSRGQRRERVFLLRVCVESCCHGNTRSGI